MSLDLFNGGSVKVAHDIIGTLLLFDGVGGIIVEAEAYDQSDPASHSFRGLRPSNKSMFGPAAHAYIYRSYGIHWCLNFVCGRTGHGAGVLIRALEPLANLDKMVSRRGLSHPRLLCAGPGRLTQALGIDKRHDGLSLACPPFELLAPRRMPKVVVGPRIGISKAIEQPWRFGLSGSHYLSRPFPRLKILSEQNSILDA